MMLLIHFVVVWGNALGIALGIASGTEWASVPREGVAAILSHMILPQAV